MKTNWPPRRRAFPPSGACIAGCLLDNRDCVEFKRYLEDLSEDLSSLLCEESGDCAVLVEGTTA
jgi:hypothetical protein